MMNARILWLAAWFLVTAACGDRNEDEKLDRRVEHLVKIQHGVYGQVTSVSDVGDPNEQYVPGFPIDVYAVPPGTELGDPVASTTSEASRGFYEVALAAGDHLVCTRFQRCVVISLVDGQLLRLDYESGPGPGWSTGTWWPPPAP